MSEALQEERSHQAKKKAMKLLERMDRTESGLFERLLQAGFSEEESREALEYVKGFGYVDDVRYAETFIRANLTIKSRSKILATLVQKGVSREVAQEAWEEVAQFEEPDEEALIRETVRKRCPEGIPSDPGELRRLYGYLARRGFSYGDIHQVLEQGL